MPRRTNAERGARGAERPEPPGSVVPRPTPRAPRSQKGWWLRAAVSAAVVAWLATRADWAAIGHALAGARLGPCLLALAIYAASQVVSSYRWQLLARPLGFTEPLGRFVTLYFVGMFFNLFLPTSVGGDVVRAWLLAGRSGRRWTAAVSVFSERFTGLLTLLLIACFASVGNLDALAPWALGTVWGATGAAFLGLALLPVLGRWHWRARSLAEGLNVYRGQRAPWAAALGLSVVVQSASVAQVWLLGGALGLRVPLVAYAVVVPLVSLLTMLPISVFGVGVREVSLVTLLAPLAVAPEAALALGVLWFALSVAASLIGGVVYLAVGDQESAVSSQQSGVSPEGTEGQGPSQREAA